jgi:lipopolysaccharide exporter
LTKISAIYKSINHRISTNEFISSFARPVSLLTGSTIIAQLLSVLIYPILTRLYTPLAFGLLTLFLTYVSVATEIAPLGYQYAIVGAKQTEDKSLLSALSIINSVIFSFVLALSLYILIRGNILGFGLLPDWSVWFAIPVVFLSAILSILRYGLIKQGDFAIISKVTVYQSIGKSISLLILGLMSLGSFGLFFCDLFGRFIGLQEMFRKVWVDLKSDLKIWFSKKNLLKVIKDYYRYPLFSLPSTILDIVAANIFIPIIVELFGVSIAGQIGLVQKIITMPFALVSRSVSDVFHNQVAVLVKEEPERIPTLILKTCFSLLLLGILPSVIIFFLAPPIFPRILGPQWQLSGLIASAIIPWTLAGFIVSPVSRLIFVSDWQEYKFVYDLLSLGFTLLALYGGKYFKFDVIQSLTLLSTLQIFSYLVYFILLLRIAYHPFKGNKPN